MTVKIMSKDHDQGSEVRTSSRKIWAVLLSIVIIILTISASLNVYYYNLSKIEESNVDGAAYEAAAQFRLCSFQISSALQTDPTVNSIGSLLQTLGYHLTTAWNMMHMLKGYLLSDYKVQMQTIEVLLENMTVGGARGVMDTLYSLLGSNNTLLMQAYRELGMKASQKIVDMGNEVGLAFWERIGNNDAVLEFRVDQSKIENATSICADLKTILNTWETTYSL